MIKFKRIYPVVLLGLGAFVAWYFKLYTYLTLESLQSNYQVLHSLVMNHWLLSLLSFVVIYVLVVMVSIPGASFMTLAGGILFGQLWGTIGAVFSATIGAQLFFMLARGVSKDLLKPRRGKWFEKLQKGLKADGFYYLLTLRFIPLFPFSAINVAAALVQMNPVVFFWGTLLGIIPGSFVYVAAGVALRVPLENRGELNVFLDKRIWIALIGLGLLSLVPVVYKKFKKNHP